MKPPTKSGVFFCQQSVNNLRFAAFCLYLRMLSELVKYYFKRSEKLRRAILVLLFLCALIYFSLFY